MMDRLIAYISDKANDSEFVSFRQFVPHCCIKAPLINVSIAKLASLLFIFCYFLNSMTL